MSQSCPRCGVEIPPESRFCKGCGHDLDAVHRSFVGRRGVLDTHVISLVLFGVAVLFLFFSLAFLLPGPEFWPASVFLFVVAVLLLVVRYLMIRAHRKQVMISYERATAKVKCRYCGTLNDQKESRCISCGAPI